MSALAESLVDEWLNRQGFFTVRGLKHGVDEIDLLGIRPAAEGLEAWHVEVQASFRPIGYISPLPKGEMDGFAKSKTSAKARSPDRVHSAAREWVAKKFTSPSKRAARESAWPGLSWKFVLVHAVVREPNELAHFAEQGVRVIALHKILAELAHGAAHNIRGGAGTDLSEIIEYFKRQGRVRAGET
jgi:hypothetical protein